jgi:hypothetical protein
MLIDRFDLSSGPLDISNCAFLFRMGYGISKTRVVVALPRSVSRRGTPLSVYEYISRSASLEYH